MPPSGTWILTRSSLEESLLLGSSQEPQSRLVAAAAHLFIFFIYFYYLEAKAPLYRRGREGSGRWTHSSQVSEAEVTPGSVPRVGTSLSELVEGVGGCHGGLQPSSFHSLT